MKTRRTRTVWIGTLLGAGLMALLDPQRGRRRRALLRDKVVRAAGAVGDAARLTWRDLRNRTRGIVAEVRHAAGGPTVPDQVLAERVRSRIGRLVSHPGAVDVSVSGGRVTLTGSVLESEADRLIAGVKKTRGVEAVEESLSVHAEPGNVPALQGGGGTSRRAVIHENWSPTARLFAGVAGAGLAAYGVKRRGWLGGGLAALGLGLFGRAATNLPANRLYGLVPSRRGIDLQKSVRFHAPVEEVFAFWSHWENLPLFLSHVREVRDNGNGSTHWEVVGPAGTAVSWDALVTAWIPNQLLAWKSVSGAAVRQSGLVRFDRTRGGGTRVDLRMTYEPPAGAPGHAVAPFFGTDPKSALDDDMIRLESLLEPGKTSAGGRQAAREEVASAETSSAPEGPIEIAPAEIAAVEVIPAQVTPGEVAPPDSAAPAPAKKRRPAAEAPGRSVSRKREEPGA